MVERDPLSRRELVELVQQIIDAAYGDSTADVHELCDRLKAAVPHPRPWDVIQGDEIAGSPEEIVEHLLAYKPIILPPPAP